MPLRKLVQAGFQLPDLRGKRMGGDCQITSAGRAGLCLDYARGMHVIWPSL